MDINFMVGTQGSGVTTSATSTTIVGAIASAIVVVVVFTVVVALERVGSASHWTRETRTTDSLRYAIAGVVVVVMVTHYPFCLFLCVMVTKLLVNEEEMG